MNGPGLLVDESVWNWRRTKEKGKAVSPPSCSVVYDKVGVNSGTNFSDRESRIDCTTALIGRMSHKILGPKVYDPTLAKKDATLQLYQERHRREVCSSKLQEIERELQDFSEAFGSKLIDLKKSMGEFSLSMRELLNYDEGNYIEGRLWEEADIESKSVGIVESNLSPPQR